MSFFLLGVAVESEVGARGGHEFGAWNVVGQPPAMCGRDHLVVAGHHDLRRNGDVSNVEAQGLTKDNSSSSRPSIPCTADSARASASI